MRPIHLIALLWMGCTDGLDEPLRKCNGSAELCTREIDQLSFAGTHNAMSSAERGWLFPNQGDAIPTQLSKGIRGLNIDLSLHTYKDR